MRRRGVRPLNSPPCGGAGIYASPCRPRLLLREARHLAIDAAVEGRVAFRKEKEGAVQGKPKPTAANNDNAKRKEVVDILSRRMSGEVYRMSVMPMGVVNLRRWTQDFNKSTVKVVEKIGVGDPVPRYD